MSDLPLVLTVEEAADALRISRGSAYEAIRTGELPHVRIGRTIRVPRHMLLSLLGERSPGPDQAQSSQPLAAGGERASGSSGAEDAA